MKCANCAFFCIETLNVLFKHAGIEMQLNKVNVHATLGSKINVTPKSVRKLTAALCSEI